MSSFVPSVTYEKGQSLTDLRIEGWGDVNEPQLNWTIERTAR